jgi:hypothetical protein
MPVGATICARLSYQVAVEEEARFLLLEKSLKQNILMYRIYRQMQTT